VTKRERVIRWAITRLEMIDRETAKEVAKDLRSLLPRRVLKAKPSRVARADRKAAQRDRSSTVRVEVFKRDGGACVVCLDPATDMHHLVYGAGMRRVAETAKTCAALCRLDHKRAHSGDPATLERLRMWAIHNSYFFAASALDRRITKIHSRAPSMEAKP
jgi:5-methylcytosine-specific restriction endonuclease McrA